MMIMCSTRRSRGRMVVVARRKEETCRGPYAVQIAQCGAIAIAPCYDWVCVGVKRTMGGWIIT